MASLLILNVFKLVSESFSTPQTTQNAWQPTCPQSNGSATPSSSAVAQKMPSTVVFDESNEPTVKNSKPSTSGYFINSQSIDSRKDLSGQVYGIMGNWVYGIMGNWVYGIMGNWVYEIMGNWVYGIMGNWVYEIMGNWVYGIMGNWVYGIMGNLVYGLTFARFAFVEGRQAVM